jgi:hypothetical protein
LGLIKVKAASDGIVGYDNLKNSILKQADLLETRFTKIIDQQTEIIDFLSIIKSRKGSSTFQLKEYPILITTDIKTMHSYYFNITVFKGSINVYTQKTEELLKQAESLILLIQKEYNL